MQKYRLKLAYEGTDFVGWQIQPEGVSIQGLLEKGLETLLGVPTRACGAGRTDAGTHALGQVAHFQAEKPFDPIVFQRALNGLLPYSIRVLELDLASESFHAQYSATGKEYHYHLWLEPIVTPFVHLYRYPVRFPLDLSLLEEAATHLVGTHDFATFANAGSSVKTTVRTLQRITMHPQEGGVRLEFEGSGFLYKMVRNLVGTLLEVALGKRALDSIPGLLAARDRRLAASAVPAKGLFLAEVRYPVEIASKVEVREVFTH